MRSVRVSIALVLVAMVSSASSSAAREDVPPVVGRWDITVTSDRGTYPSWLEVEPSGSRTLVGRFVGQVGSARPVSEVRYEGGKLSFSVPPQWEQGDKDIVFEGQVQGETLAGWTTDASGVRSTWTAVRAPELAAARAPRWGKAVPLLNGKNLDGWAPRTSDKSNWVVRDKTLVNTDRGSDLETTARYRDFKLHVEFRYPAGGNSGVYLRGRYEVQIADEEDRVARRHGLGAVYGFLTPAVKPVSRPGEWQTYDITLVGRTITVVLNGTTLICEQEIPGITGGALDSDEGAPGPILLQGDHGPVEYRSMVITPANP